MRRRDAFYYLVDLPAYGVGSLVGAFAHLAFIIAGAAAGVFIGRLIWYAIRVKLIAWPFAIFIGIWITLIIASAEPWAAAEMQRAYHHRDDD